MELTRWIICSVSCWLISMALTGLIIPQILLIAFRRQLFDGHDERKIHQGTVPRLGGIAFVPAIILSLSFVYGTVFLHTEWDMLSFVNLSRHVTMCYSLCAIMILYLVGMADDLVGVKYRAKFVAQIFAAVLIVVSGQWINNLDGLFGIYEISAPVGMTLTVLVVVFIINSINLIDGIDGLASGLSAMALLCYGTIFIMLGHYVLATLAFAALGTLIPFFYFNVMGDAVHKRKIFMGDTGALTIGFLLSLMAVEMTLTSPDKLVHVDSVVLAFSPLILPCFDVIRVFVPRLRMKQNPFLPDRCHIHHKLLALGLNSHAVMLMILLWGLAYALLSIMMSRVMNVTFVLIIDFGAWVLINWWLTHIIYKRKKRNQSGPANIYG